MMTYCDFTYYVGTFLGNVIPEIEFSRLSLRASAVVDQITFNRAPAQTDVSVIDAIKMSVCAIAEEIYAIELEGSQGGVISETIGRHSVTYSENSIQQASIIDRYIGAASMYLSVTGLLFRGFTEDER